MASLWPHRGYRIRRFGAFALCAGLLPLTTVGQSEGGLYIAGDGFSFEQAANRGLSQNPRGQRFFVLSLPPNSTALMKSAPKATVALRERVTASNGVLLVCQRDVDSGAIDASKLIAGVVAVRGFPPPGSNPIPPGERDFPDENRANLPQSNDALRRLRSACS